MKRFRENYFSFLTEVGFNKTSYFLINQDIEKGYSPGYNDNVIFLEVVQLLPIIVLGERKRVF